MRNLSLAAFLVVCSGICVSCLDKTFPVTDVIISDSASDLADGRSTHDTQHSDLPAVDTIPDNLHDVADAIDTTDAGHDSTDIELDMAADETAAPDVVPEGAIYLASDGSSLYTILLSAEASPSEALASQDLQFYFEATTGIQLPVVVEGSAEAAGIDEDHLILVGASAKTASLGIEPTPEQLGPQGYVLRTVNTNVAVVGTRQAGTMYGVHRLIEQVLGVRWFAPEVTKIPTKSSAYIVPSDELVKPAFQFRQTYYTWPGGDQKFRTLQGENVGGAGPDHELGLQYSADGLAHSYFNFISPDEFFDTHPEYFSEIGGVRVRDDTQLCLTNPEVLDIVAERMLQRMASNPHAHQHNFSQMDRYNYCQCDKCKAMNEQYGTAGGTQFWFVNELAKRTSQVYPDKLIGTLAYMYTEEPPVGLEMHPNVAVWLCHMYPSCDSHPIATCPENADYKRRAESWSELSEHLYVWHYVVDFSHYYNPFPNFTAMAADMRFYRDIGVEGIFMQGMGQSGGGGEWSLLRPYYGSRLMWDPDVDPVALRRDFLKGYYGEAWKPLDKYIDLLLDEVTDKNIHMHLYTNPGQGYLSDPIMEQSKVLFDQAEANVANDPELLERVRVARMPLSYASLFPRNGYEVVGDKLVWGGDIISGPDLVAFLDRMKVHGFQIVREVGGDPALLMLLYSFLSSDLDVKVIDNGILRVEVVPNLGGRTLRIVHKASGQSITAYNRVPSLFFPFAGGVEDRIGGFFEAYGWVEPATVSHKDEQSITVHLSTLNGYGVDRTVTLEPGSSTVLFSTTITNNNGSAREDRFRFHTEFDLGDLQTTEVTFNNKDGNLTSVDIDQVISEQREGIHYYNTSAPAGSWEFTGSKGLTVTQEFDEAVFEFAWLYSYPASLNDLEAEIWSPKLHLEAGESRTFEQTMTVTQ